MGIEIRAFIEGKANELVLLDEVLKLGTIERKEQLVVLNNMLLTRRVYQEMVLLNAEGQE